MPERPYIFYELTNSICSTCYRKVEGKIVEQEGKIYMIKRCPHHGAERVLLSGDVRILQNVPLLLETIRDAPAF